MIRKRNRNGRKRFVLPAVVLLLSVLLPAMPAFADVSTVLPGSQGTSDAQMADINNRIQESRTKLESLMQQNMTEETLELGEELLSSLDSQMDDITTVDEAKNRIGRAIDTLDEKDNPGIVGISDPSLRYLKNIWQDAFADLASMYGISGGTSQGAGEVDYATKKVNLLTWGNGTMNSDEDGAVQGLLTRFDTLGMGVKSDGSSYSGIVCGIAIALAVTFSVSSMLTMITDRNLSTEAISREFMKLIFGVWFIYNYRWFALLIIYFGTALVTLVMQTTQGSQANLIKKCVYDSLYAIVDKYGDTTFSLVTDSAMGLMNDLSSALASVASGVGGAFSSMFTGLMSVIGGGLIQLASSLTIYAILIELGIRYFLTPIAIADLYSERFRSNGWMWLKKLFAVSIQGAVIFLIVFAAEALKNTLDSFDIITNTAINLTMIGMFAKSRSLANDVIGVH